MARFGIPSQESSKTPTAEKFLVKILVVMSMILVSSLLSSVLMLAFDGCLFFLLARI